MAMIKNHQVIMKVIVSFFKLTDHLNRREKNSMNDQSKTKHELIQELVSLRKRIAELSQYKSEHKQVGESLRNSEDMYKSLIEHIPDIIFIIIDLEGTITFVSKKAKEILGYDNEETINRNILNFISEEAHESTMEKLQKGMEGEKIKHVQLPVTAKSGKKLFFDFSFSRIYKDGVVVGAQGTAVDVTERKLAEEALREAEESLSVREKKYRLLADNMKDFVWTTDMNLRSTYLSPSIEKVFGYSIDELMELPIDKHMTVESYNIAMAIFAEEMEKERVGTFPPDRSRIIEIEYFKKDGTTILTEVKLAFIRDERGATVGIIGCGRDITERKQSEKALQESEARFREVLENSLDVSYNRNLKTDSYDYLSPSFTKNYGYTLDEMMNLPLETLMNLVHPDDLAEIGSVIAESNSGTFGAAYHMKYRFRHKDGPYRWCHDQFTVMRDADGIPLAIIGSVRDITEQKQAEYVLRESEHRYQELSVIDDLTQLYNSRHFYAQLEREIGRSNRYKQPLTLLLLDLDKFKEFNDTYGHVEGNHVLSRLGRVVKRCLRNPDSAYRYGGEEFTIMLPMTTSEEGMITAQRIQLELRKEKFSPVLDQEVYMTVSIGLAQYKPKEEMKAFVHRVDQLMYQAKKNGRNRICPEL